MCIIESLSADVLWCKGILYSGSGESDYKCVSPTSLSMDFVANICKYDTHCYYFDR